jgi:DDE superfamily endonuclease
MCPLYVMGLIGPGDRKSVQPMAERLAPGDYDQLHHFVAAGVWDAAPLETELLVQADKLVGGSDAVMVIDDTAVPKKGKHSVGVAWQYASALGKNAGASSSRALRRCSPSVCAPLSWLGEHKLCKTPANQCTLTRIGEGGWWTPGSRDVGGSKMAEEEFTGMYELLDALEAALKTADPAKRQALAKTSDAYHWAIGAHAPTLLYHLFMSIDAACRPDKQSKPRGVIRLADLEPEGGNA